MKSLSFIIFTVSISVICYLYYAKESPSLPNVPTSPYPESNYNDKLAELTTYIDVSSHGVSCNDSTCGLIVQGKNEASLNEFQEEFLKGRSTGNYFVSIQVEDK